MKKIYGIILGICVCIILLFVFTEIRHKGQPQNNVEKEEIGGSAIVDENTIIENDTTYIE